MKKFFSKWTGYKASSVLAFALSFLILSGASVAYATLTFNATSITGSTTADITGAAGSAVTMGSATTTGNIGIGAALTSGTLSLGNAAATGITTINGSTLAGTNTLYNNATTANIAIGGALTTGTLTLGGSMVYTPQVSPLRDIFELGADGNDATLRVFSEDQTAFAIKGIDFTDGTTVVNSYSGIFGDASYSDIGTDDTRFITGGNPGMDVQVQSADALLLVAQDGASGNGVVKVMSQNGIEFHAQYDAEQLSPKRLIVSRVSTATTGAANTSDVTLGTNDGDLIIQPTQGSVTISRALTLSSAVNKGTVTLDGAGSGTATVTAGAVCVVSDASAVAPAKGVVSSTTLTISGTALSNINYICL